MAKDIKSVTRSNAVEKITQPTLINSKAISRQYDKFVRGKQGGDQNITEKFKPRGGKGMKCLGGNCSGM